MSVEHRYLVRVDRASGKRVRPAQFCQMAERWLLGTIETAHRFAAPIDALPTLRAATAAGYTVTLIAERVSVSRFVFFKARADWDEAFSSKGAPYSPTSGAS